MCNRPNVFMSGYTSRQAFSENLKLVLVDYIIKYPKLNYRTTYKQIRQMKYDYVGRLECKFPSSWTDNRLQEFTGYRAL